MFSKKSGFGLIEVMVSLVVVIIVVGAAGAVTRASVNTAIVSQESIVASGLAQGLIESARTYRNNNPSGPIEISFSPEVTLNNVKYTQSAEINTVEESEIYGGMYWQVNAIIKWNDSRTGNQQQYKLETILTKWPS